MTSIGTSVDRSSDQVFRCPGSNVESATALVLCQIRHVLVIHAGGNDLGYGPLGISL